MPTLARGCVAEFIGTFALVFFGAGSIVLTQDAIGAGSLITVAAAHAIALIVFISGAFYISGAQFNPSVSIALAVIGKQSPVQAGAFVVAQLLAAACAAGMVVVAFGPDLAHAVGVGATLPSAGLADLATPGRVFVVEALMTFALMFVILTTLVDGRNHKLGGLCIGLVVAACILAFGPLTGASMNPARSFGPALYGNWDMHWIYWLAPITGASLAALVYKFVWLPASEPNES